ncbi:rCG58011 [Rattus norvegicus]|uniref:RCG58011 n=1 Tax=Rattus norvegicus TaxID=10116 RepID=A6J566_RAT|nr:rCG58011 [Rattus norvegicus]
MGVYHKLPEVLQRLLSLCSNFFQG